MATEAISRRIIAIKHLNVPSEIQLSFISFEWFECWNNEPDLTYKCSKDQWSFISTSFVDLNLMCTCLVLILFITVTWINFGNAGQIHCVEWKLRRCQRCAHSILLLDLCHMWLHFFRPACFLFYVCLGWHLSPLIGTCSTVCVWSAQIFII